MKSRSTPRPGVALPALPSTFPVPAAVAEETLLRPSGTQLSVWQRTEEDLNFALKSCLYLSPDMLLFMIQDIKEILVLFVSHLISF